MQAQELHAGEEFIEIRTFWQIANAGFAFAAEGFSEKRISPLLGRIKSKRHLIVVVLPEPLLPTKPEVWPSGKEKVTSAGHGCLFRKDRL